MREFIFTSIAILWIPFTYWTVCYLRKLRNQPEKRIIYRRGVLGFGVPFWLMSVVMALTLLQDQGLFSLLRQAAGLLYFLFPLCLWGGYFWGEGMKAVFPGWND